LSRVFNQAVVQPLHENIVFGSIPHLTDEEVRRSKRLSDQIGLLKEKGYEEGYQAGYQNGLQMGTAEGRKVGFAQAQEIASGERQTEAAQFFADWEMMREEFEQAVIQWFEQSEEILTGLAVEAVRRILNAELQLTRDSALEIAKEVLSHVSHAKQARIRINPDDFALFESHREELSKHSMNVKGIEIVQDNSISSGVIVETEAGVIDATIQTRLELFENSFEQAA
jgi:flagellar assembly protein FliH